MPNANEPRGQEVPVTIRPCIAEPVYAGGYVPSYARERVGSDINWGAVLFGVAALLVGGFILYATIAVASNGSLTCDAECWTAKRAIANSNANARAGFGNDDAATRQTAVKPDKVVSPPATIIYAPPAQVVMPVPSRAPAAAASLPCGGKCGVGGVARPKYQPGTPRTINGVPYRYGQSKSGQWGWCRVGGAAC